MVVAVESSRNARSCNAFASLLGSLHCSNMASMCSCSCASLPSVSNSSLLTAGLRYWMRLHVPLLTSALPACSPLPVQAGDGGGAGGGGAQPAQVPAQEAGEGIAYIQVGAVEWLLRLAVVLGGLCSWKWRLTANGVCG